MIFAVVRDVILQARVLFLFLDYIHHDKITEPLRALSLVDKCV